MSSRRIAKVAEAVREIVSTVVLFELKDPRVKNVTVLRADVSPDLRNAKVYVSVMGDEKTQQLSLHGLNAARGFIQSKIADRLQTRYTPVLRFVTDPAVKLSIAASAVIRDALRDSEEAADASVSESGESEHGESESGQVDSTDSGPDNEDDAPDEELPS